MCALNLELKIELSTYPRVCLLFDPEIIILLHHQATAINTSENGDLPHHCYFMKQFQVWTRPSKLPIVQTILIYDILCKFTPKARHTQFSCPHRTSTSTHAANAYALACSAGNPHKHNRQFDRQPAGKHIHIDIHQTNEQMKTLKSYIKF